MLYNSKQEEYKYKNWIFTWNAESDEYLISDSDMKSVLDDIAEEYVFQREKATRLHIQGFIGLANRTRKKTLLNLISGRCTHLPKGIIHNLTVNNIRGTKDECVSYVTKSETRISPTIYSHGLKPYTFSDLAVLDNQDRWFPWQRTISELIFSKDGSIIQPDDRTIIWVEDKVGNTGKSKFVKYYVHQYPKNIIKLPFGSASQLRSAICTAGPRSVYFIDIPRTMGSDDDLDSLYSVIEDLKNGFITTSMYGKFQQLLFEPPHVVVFTNINLPTGKLSRDRWQAYYIENQTLKKYG